MARWLLTFFATLATALKRRVVRVHLVGAIVLGSLMGRIVRIGLVGVMVLLAHGGAPLGGWRLQPKNALRAEKLFCVEATKKSARGNKLMHQSIDQYTLLALVETGAAGAFHALRHGDHQLPRFVVQTPLYQ